MIKPITFVSYICFLLCIATVHSQSTQQSISNDLFGSEAPIEMSFNFSTKEVKKNTNDSTYVLTDLKYSLDNKTWSTIEAQIRARGNFRRKQCYFPPIKMEFTKSSSENTIFQNNRKLKTVLPCLVERVNNDCVIKEYLAYKMYEIISPYYFKVRLVNLELNDTRRKNKPKVYNLKAFVIEDIKNVAKRFNSKRVKRVIHPMNHDHLSSIRNDLFQYMVGNTDFSTAYQHNCKLLFVEKKFIPVPYDFDMTGFVNTTYAVTSKIEGQDLGNASVRDRKYRGFKREKKHFYEIRKEFLEKKPQIMTLLDKHKSLFENNSSFEEAKDYILGFYETISNEKRFDSQIISQARVK